MRHLSLEQGKDEAGCSAGFFPPSRGATPGQSDGPLVEEKEGLLVLEPRTKTKRPPFYKVVMLNDDYTPMDFVVEILKSIFRKTQQDAITIMLEIHQKGSGLCGIFTHEIAETKVEMVIAIARQNEYPLQCVMERE